MIKGDFYDSCTPELEWPTWEIVPNIGNFLEGVEILSHDFVDGVMGQQHLEVKAKNATHNFSG